MKFNEVIELLPHLESKVEKKLRATGQAVSTQGRERPRSQKGYRPG